MNRIDRKDDFVGDGEGAFWRHPCFAEMSLLKARFTRHRYALHTHETYVVALVTQGCERLRVGRRRELAPSGTIILVNPEECHDGEAGPGGGWAYRVFYPAVPLMTQVAAELGLAEPPLFGRPCIEDPELVDTLLAAHLAAEASDGVEAEASLLTALELLILRYSDRRATAPADRLAGARERLELYARLIKEEAGEALSLAAFASAAHVDRFQVIRDFKRLTGLTPGGFIRNHRLRRARRLIESGADLAQAAAEAGFADQSHLSRVFRSMVGVTPGEFRAAIADR